MQRKTVRIAGFTLIELLVVIAVIALLVSMLMPMLSRARQIALQVKCRSQYRQIGLAIHGFAEAHDGRAPSGAYSFTTTDPSKWLPVWPDYGGTLAGGTSWVSLLNSQYFRSTVMATGMPYRDTDDMNIRKSRLVCPSVQSLAINYCRREMVANVNLLGGGWWASNTLSGPYGRVVTPSPIPPWQAYVLGTDLGQFRSPSSKFAMWEAEVASDDCSPRTSDGSGPGTSHSYYVNDIGSSVPAYLGAGGWFAFRHTLPTDRRLYSTRATANFLFIDGHAESLIPLSRIESIDRYQLN